MSPRTRALFGRVARAACLSVTLGSLLASPPPASAQLVGSLVVTVTSPQSGSTVGGPITVTASVSVVGLLVQGVQFQLDGNNLGPEDTAAPYSAPWNTVSAANGSHTLRAVARDALGIWYPSQPVTVTVFNDKTPPTVAITFPGEGASVGGTISVSASATDNVGVTGVQFQLDGANLGAEDTTAPYSVSWNTIPVGDGTHTLRAIGRDAAGNSTISPSVTVTVANDTVLPTVAITGPSSGATVWGTTTVSASASDNIGVAGVRFVVDGANIGAEDTTAPYSVSWNTTTATDGAHTLTAVARDAANNTTTSSPVTVSVANNGSAPGDVFVAVLGGAVQWRSPNGTLRQTLPGYSDGQVSSVAFDGAGNLYVPHWAGATTPGNTIARYAPNGILMGTFGSGYNLNPSSMAFDADGNVYVGQADGTGDILKFDPAGNLIASFDVAVGTRGTDHIDLASDGCTMFYASRTKDVFRYDVCTGTQLPNFNTQPLPGYETYHLRVLPDGGVLVADTAWIVRLDASGNQVQTYEAPGEYNYWGGVDLVGDGTFWASNAFSATIYRFNLQSGAIVSSFTTGTGEWSAAGVGVKPMP